MRMPSRMPLFPLLLAGLVALASCAAPTPTPTPSPIPTPTEVPRRTLAGVVQKGPFVNGSSLTVFELDDHLVQTGKSYNTQILDNSGTYSLAGIPFTSNYVLLKADGFYFDEAKGENATAPITLYAIADITDRTTVNVNLMSHLEKGRVEYLAGTGISLSDAKHQADQEILRMCSLEKADFQDPDRLDIAAAGDDNAILLAVTMILAGGRDPAQLSELLANLASDLRTDGTLDSTELQTQLAEGIYRVSRKGLGTVRRNLEERYAALGESCTIPDFEIYVQRFLENTAFPNHARIQYPANGASGPNFLNSTASYTMRAQYGSGLVERYDQTFPHLRFSVAAIVPEGGSLTVRIRIKANPHFKWGVAGGSSDYGGDVPLRGNTWTIVQQDMDHPSIQTDIAPIHYDGYFNDVAYLSPVFTGQLCDAEFLVMPFTADYLIEYFEDGATTPTFTRTKHVEYTGDFPISWIEAIGTF